MKKNDIITAEDLLRKILDQREEIQNRKNAMDRMADQINTLNEENEELKDENEKLRLALKALAESSKQKRVEELEEENRELKKQYDALVDEICKGPDKIIPPVICPLMKDSIREWCYGKE